MSGTSQSGPGDPSWRDALAVAGIKLASAAVVLGLGFTAVSDDDYARVVIAQEWAHAPRLDPSGTSWLPLPFWLTGGVFLVAGRSLAVARGLAIAAGVLAALLVWASARRITGDRKAALAGGILAAVFPWSAVLGVATVPELPTAALGVFAVATTVPPDGVRPFPRWLGGLALVAATLSRYEAWPVAACFAAISIVDALRATGTARPGLAAAAALALLGPAAWIGWNRGAHGAAFQFVDRVTAYHRAVGPEHDTLLERLWGYPAAALLQEPTLPLLLLAAVAIAIALGTRAQLRERLRRFGRPALVAASVVLVLGVAAAKDGAPTHHPERAMLLPMLLLALAAGDACVLSARHAAANGRTARLALVGVPLFALLFGEGVLRPRAGGFSFIDRRDEVAIGAEVRAVIAGSERVLVEVVDHGFLAIMAASAAPEALVPDRSIDPRSPAAQSSFDDIAALERRLAEAAASHFVARQTPRLDERFGPARARAGAWGLWSLPARSPRPPGRPHE